MHFDVATAANGADALALCVEAPPHVLVADLRMPKMNGYELLVALRANASTSTIPAIATSASLDEEARALSQGFEAFCAKPCDPQKLTLAVVSVLLRHAAAAPATVAIGNLPVQVRASSDGMWWGVWHGPQLVSRWTSEFSARDAARVFSDTRDVPLDLGPLPGRPPDKL
jgi:CheY-like chemotaxis protein